MKVLLSVPMNRPPVAEVNINDNGLGFIAAAFKKAGAEVNLFSWNMNLDYDVFKNKIKEIQPDIFGLKVFTVNFIQVYKTLHIVRETLPHTIIIVGGPHPSTVQPDDLFSEFGHFIDYAIAGDGECGIMELTKLIIAANGKPSPEKLGDVPGLIYRHGDTVKYNKKCFNIDLEDIPPQDWNLQPPSSFTRNMGAGVDVATLDFQGIGNENNFAARKSILFHDSRGCHERCGHCGSWLINGPDARNRELDSVIKELDMLVHDYGVRVLEFTGNELFRNLDYFTKICHWFINLDVPVRWGCTGGPNADKLLNADLLDLMYRAGCTTIHFGVESGSPAVRKRLRKNLPLSKITEIVTLATSKGIRVEGGFMFGFPDETVAEMNDTIKYAFTTPFSKLAFVICLPLPGTTGYKAVLDKFGIARIDWSKYDFSNPNMLPSAATLGQVRRAFMKAKIIRKFRFIKWIYRRIYNADQPIK